MTVLQMSHIFRSSLPASTTRKKRKRSRLLSSIQNGNLDKVAKALVNCDPNFVDESSGETPLSLSAASQPQSSGTLQQLIVAIVNGGALLDFRTKDGRTALHVAVQKSNFVALKTLLDLGASPNYVDANGLTPLYYSVLHKANPKLTQLLLYEHATHGITDQHGWQEAHHVSDLSVRCPPHPPPITGSPRRPANWAWWPTSSNCSSTDAT